MGMRSDEVLHQTQLDSTALRQDRDAEKARADRLQDVVDAGMEIEQREIMGPGRDWPLLAGPRNPELEAKQTVRDKLFNAGVLHVQRVMQAILDSQEVT